MDSKKVLKLSAQNMCAEAKKFSVLLSDQLMTPKVVTGA